MSSHQRPSWTRSASDVRLLLLTLSGGVLPLFLLGIQALDIALPRFATIALLATSVAWIVLVGLKVRASMLDHVRMLSLLLDAAGTEEDGVKGVRAREPGELGQLYRQVNVLLQKLKVERQTEQELLAVLEHVVNRIDVSIVVCDSQDKVRMLNQRACSLLRSTQEQLVGVVFSQTPLAGIVADGEARLVEHRFKGGEGRWQVGQHYYRHQGIPSRIVFIIDVKQMLLGEEVSSWQRLIRVISHEVNNTLTPIISLCQTLSTLLERSEGFKHAGDALESLDAISVRTRGLKEFITAYARIAKLPEPNKVLFPVSRLVARLKSMFPAASVRIEDHDVDLRLYGDPVHLEQVLINLVRNALEASKKEATPVRVRCGVRDGRFEFEVVDSGTGISNPSNLFVPFYTTKSDGAGIGLVLCSQIAARHHGHVTLENREDSRGAVARLTLPLPPGPSTR